MDAISCRWYVEACSFPASAYGCLRRTGKGELVSNRSEVLHPLSSPFPPSNYSTFYNGPARRAAGRWNVAGSGQRLPADLCQPRPVVSCRLVLPGCVGTLHQRAERCSAAHCSVSHGGEARPTQRSRSTPERRETGSKELHYRGDLVHTPLPCLGCTHAGTLGRCINPPTCNGKDAPPTVLLSRLDPVQTLVGENDTRAHLHTRRSMNTLMGRK